MLIKELNEIVIFKLKLLKYRENCKSFVINKEY